MRGQSWGGSLARAVIGTCTTSSPVHVMPSPPAGACLSYLRPRFCLPRFCLPRSHPFPSAQGGGVLSLIPQPIHGLSRALWVSVPYTLSPLQLVVNHCNLWSMAWCVWSRAVGGAVGAHHIVKLLGHTVSVCVCVSIWRIPHHDAPRSGILSARPSRGCTTASASPSS